LAALLVVLRLAFVRENRAHSKIISQSKAFRHYLNHFYYVKRKTHTEKIDVRAQLKIIRLLVVQICGMAGEHSKSEGRQNMLKRGRGRPRNAETPKHLTLMLKHELHRKIKKQADADGLELLPWIRFACIRELQRRKRAA
jgi:hypothetical protein